MIFESRGLVLSVEANNMNEGQENELKMVKIQFHDMDTEDVHDFYIHENMGKVFQVAEKLKQYTPKHFIGNVSKNERKGGKLQLKVTDIHDLKQK